MPSTRVPQRALTRIVNWIKMPAIVIIPEHDGLVNVAGPGDDVVDDPDAGVQHEADEPCRDPGPVKFAI